MKKTCNTIYKFILLLLIVSSLMQLSACAAGDKSPEPRSGEKSVDMVTEYSASRADIPDAAGRAIAYCVSEDCVYILGDGSGENSVVRYNISENQWEGINAVNPGYSTVSISYYDKLWVLQRDENRNFYLYSIGDSQISEAIKLSVPADITFSGFYAYSDGLLLWNYSQLYLCDPATGKIIREKELDNTCTLSGITVNANGIYAQVNKGGERFLEKIEDVFSSSEHLIKYDGLSGLVPLCISSGDNCLLSELDSLMSYNMNRKVYEKLFSWADVGCLMPDIIPAVIELPDEAILLLDRYSNSLVRLTPRLVPRRTVITLATSFSSSLLNDLIREYNESNSLYKVEVELYSMNDVDRLRTEIIAGNGPDIIDTFSLPLAGEVSGYYENLLPYIEEDQEISVKDFVPCVFEAGKINGALYYIMPSFDVRTAVALGKWESAQCSFDEYKLRFADVENRGIEKNMTPEELFEFALPVIEKDILSSPGDSTNMDTECLKEWLNFCAEAASFDISIVSIGNCLRVAALSENLGGEVSFVGLPGQTSCGSYAIPSSMCFAMLSTGANKNAAWDFMRLFLLPDYQENIVPFGFPIISKSLDTVIQDAVDDEDLQFSEYDAKKLHNLISSIDVVSFSNNGLGDVLSADANAFFSGQHSTDEIVERMKSKINIYLAEQYG